APDGHPAWHQLCWSDPRRRRVRTAGLSMYGIVRRPWAGLVSAVLVVWTTAAIGAQGKTDVVTLANGDRITGEVVRVTRGRLEFSTDDVGTLYLEWDKLV